MLSNTLGNITQRTFNELPNFSSYYHKFRLNSSLGIFCQDFLGHFGCVNALEFSENGKYLASAGDDRRVLLWDMDKTLISASEPLVLNALHNSNIFCVAFDSKTQNIYSSGNDEQVIHHDLVKNAAKNVFVYDEAVYGISIDPTNDNIYCVACEDGQILLTDTRTVSDPLRIASYMSAFHSVMYNPVDPNYLVTANTKEGIGLWDIRRPGSCFYRYRSAPANGPLLGAARPEDCDNYATSAKFNRQGSLIMTLRRKSGPEIYRSILRSAPTEVRSKADQSRPLYTFDHDTYYNSCTMKSGCFAGQEDEFVVSGSDDFNVYVWKIPDSLGTTRNRSSDDDSLGQDGSLRINEPHLILSGHRSIVNQVRFEPNRNILVSSGVEKVIKVWSPNPIGLKDKDLLRHGPNARSSHSEGYNGKSLCRAQTVSPKLEQSALSHDTGISSTSLSSDTSFLGNEPCLNISAEGSSHDISASSTTTTSQPPTQDESADPGSVNRFRNVILRAHAMLSYDFAEHSIAEDAGMLSFFDSLLQRELNGTESGWDSDTLEDDIRAYDIRTSISPSVVRSLSSSTFSPSSTSSSSNNNFSAISSPGGQFSARSPSKSPPGQLIRSTSVCSSGDSSDFGSNDIGRPLLHLPDTSLASERLKRSASGDCDHGEDTLDRLPLKKRPRTLTTSESGSYPPIYRLITNGSALDCDDHKDHRFPNGTTLPSNFKPTVPVQDRDVVSFYQHYYASFRLRSLESGLMPAQNHHDPKSTRTARCRLLRLIRDKKQRDTLIKRRRAHVKVRRAGQEVCPIVLALPRTSNQEFHVPPVPGLDICLGEFNQEHHIAPTTQTFQPFKNTNSDTASSQINARALDSNAINRAPQNAHAIRDRIRRLAALKRETTSSREIITFETDSKVPSAPISRDTI